VIDPTEEMEQAFDDAAYPLGLSKPDLRLGLAAVLAIVERDQAGPCQVELHMLVNGPATPCELRHGHLGDHVSGVTRWRERPATPCQEETYSWDHFTAEQVDAYWIRCTLQGPHDEHKDEHTGLTWTVASPSSSAGDVR
jgi:hypothetical protein